MARPSRSTGRRRNLLIELGTEELPPKSLGNLSRAFSSVIFDNLVEAIETVFKKYQGRPHWGKMHNLTATDLRQLYPEWDMAIEARRELDPNNRLVTPYIASLLGL